MKRIILFSLIILYFSNPVYADNHTYCKYLKKSNKLLEKLSSSAQICEGNQSRFTSQLNRTKAMITATKSFTNEYQRISRLKFHFEEKTQDIVSDDLKKLHSLILIYTDNQIEMNENILGLDKEYEANLETLDAAQIALENYLQKNEYLEKKIFEEKSILAAEYPSGCAMMASNIFKIYLPFLGIFGFTIWWFFIKNY